MPVQLLLIFKSHIISKRCDRKMHESGTKLLLLALKLWPRLARKHLVNPMPTKPAYTQSKQVLFLQFCLSHFVSDSFNVLLDG